MANPAASRPARPAKSDDLSEELSLLGDQPRGIVLDLADMVSDENGEVVLFNDSGLRALELSADARIVAEGVMNESHLTSGGDDVEGYRFVSFDNGTTIFFQDGFDLVVTHGC